MPSVVIPAHNEAKVIDRLLRALTGGGADDSWEIVVVSNGSTDDTAERARRHPGVQVLELAEGSKHLALLAGDAHVHTFPRIYVDADIEFDRASADALADALAADGIEAAAPRRILDLTGSSWPVRAHYRVWEQLPVVQQGLFGRGVMAVSAAGYARIADRPAVLGDDLYLHGQFAPGERRIVDGAVSVVRGPRTMGDLLRRRARAAQGNTQLARSVGSSTGGTVRDLARVVARRPSLLPSAAVFLFVTVAGRLRGRRLHAKGSTAWLRDESSRG